MEALLAGDRCEELREVGVVNLIVSVVIVIGMLISYLPQHFRIINRRTSEGISPYFVLLGTTSATSAFANILLLPKSRQDVACCKELDSFHCVAGLLGIAQLGVQWICFTFIFVLFLVFFRYNSVDDAGDNELVDDGQPRWQTALLVASLTLLHGLAVIVITGVLSTAAKDYLAIWANVLGVMAALLAGVQYIPQIWTTYHLKHVGSLSIPMMCIQTPGGFLFAGSLFARLGWAGWSSWGIFLLTATMQGFLLYLAIYYEIQSRTSGAEAPKSPSPILGRSQLQANVFDDDTPGRYTSHPEIYAASPSQLQTIVDRQESDAATDTTPLLRPGGIGDPHRNYDTNRS
ncbi:hypothetical protein C8A03DRAFT_34709 [Achaetomium macrosporum]|uniref:PQ loop repeat protein n=1 Tax=Achaetomium macrosporum TaxID=79813 RepID=A0AAN7C8F4_9PEZI|nr:hypothetical protein C8A03DRAFT_34709 [Achaetomium macrosporum]